MQIGASFGHGVRVQIPVFLLLIDDPGSGSGMMDRETYAVTCPESGNLVSAEIGGLRSLSPPYRGRAGLRVPVAEVTRVFFGNCDGGRMGPAFQRMTGCGAEAGDIILR